MNLGDFVHLTAALARLVDGRLAHALMLHAYVWWSSVKTRTEYVILIHRQTLVNYAFETAPYKESSRMRNMQDPQSPMWAGEAIVCQVSRI